jgi:SAM-dependent methyltransferase
MEDKEYKLVREVQDKHWFWLGRQKIVQTILEHHIDLSRKLLIADAGCGFGANISFLRQYGDVVGLEMNEEALKTVGEKWADSVQLLQWKSPEKLAQRFDLILMTDVLEHIPDDAEAVEWIYEHLKARGYALLTVPAHQFLWTEMDEVVHHYRRYGSKDFLSLFENKFDIIQFSFYNLSLFLVKVGFVIFARGLRLLLPKREKRSYNDVPPLPINTFFKYVLYFESRLIRYVSLPFGISIVALFQKRNSL